jgi:hypothetical protein
MFRRPCERASAIMTSNSPRSRVHGNNGNTQHAGCSRIVHKIALGQSLSNQLIEFAVHSYLPDGVEATTKAWVVKQWWQEDTRPEAEGYFADEPS